MLIKAGRTYVRVSFAWYDVWIGAYLDRRSRVLHVCPLPMLLISIWRG